MPGAVPEAGEICLSYSCLRFLSAEGGEERPLRLNRITFGEYVRCVEEQKKIKPAQAPEIRKYQADAGRPEEPQVCVLSSCPSTPVTVRTQAAGEGDRSRI